MSTIPTVPLSEIDVITKQRDALRAEVLAWRDYALKRVVRVGNTNEPREADVYYEGKYWKAVEDAVVATDATGVLHGFENTECD